MQGKDKHGRPIVVVHGSRHYACTGAVDELRRTLVLFRLNFSFFFFLFFLFFMVSHMYVWVITGFVVFSLDKLCQRYRQTFSCIEFIFIYCLVVVHACYD